MKTLNRKRFITLSAIAAGFISLFSYCFGSWTFIQDRDVGFGFQNSNAQPVAYLSSNKDVKYSSLDKAIKVAKGLANSQTPQTVIVIPNSTIEISTLTIPSYVTVFVPLSSTETIEKIADQKSSMYGFYPISDNTVNLDDFADSSSSTSNRETVLKVKNNLVISANAELVVDGVLGNAGSGLSGQTTGKYSEIQLFPSALLKNSGLFDCRGYVKTVEANGVYTREDNRSVCQNLSNGRVYAPFVVDDYGGGSHTVGSYLAGGVCPFSGMEMPNIQSSFVINASSKLYGWADLYTNAIESLKLPATHNRCAPLIIASNDAIINLGTNGKITCKYTPKEAGKTINDWSTGRKYAADGSEFPFGKYSFVLTGGASSGSLNMIVAVGKGQVPISTSDVLFPVSWKYDISLENGTYVFDTQMKFLPGSSVVVNNATLNIKSRCVFYNGGMDDKKSGGCYPYAKNQKAANFLIKDASVSINNSFGGFVNGQASDQSMLTVNTQSLALSVSEGQGDFVTNPGDILTTIPTGVTGILEFLGGKKEYADIAGDVKKLARYTPTFTDNVETKGYIDSKSTIKRFETNKYKFSTNNQFWEIDYVVTKPLQSVTIKEKNDNYSSGKAKAATFNIIATFNPSDFDELVVSFEWKQKRQKNVSEDGTFVNSKLEGTTFNTVANKGVFSSDNKIDVWLEITLKGHETPVVSNKLMFNARNWT